MLFKDLKGLNCKYLLALALVVILSIWFLFFATNTIKQTSQQNQDVFGYTIKVQSSVEELDKIFERAELNVDVMVDTISNSYDIKKQHDKAYNLHFVQGVNGLLKSVLANSPCVDGSWFQLNADLPFSAGAYNWFAFRDNQFINVRDQFEGTPALNRKITPEDDPYYFDAIMNQRATWSDIYKDADTKNSMITISSPVYQEGSLVGVVGIDIATDNLQEVLKCMQAILGDSELFLLNKKNKVILSQLSYNFDLKEGDYPFLDLFKTNKHGPVEYSDNLSKKTAIRVALSNDYKIVISMNNKSLFPETSRMLSVICILFVLLILSILGGFLSHFKPTKKPEVSKVVAAEAESKKNIEE